VQARIEAGQRAFRDDWSQGTQQFMRPAQSIADKARQSRGQNLPTAGRATLAPWNDDNDPDLMESPQMSDGPFRHGRNPLRG
jgi:hypothetical protein